jgi:hypothetical protein
VGGEFQVNTYTTGSQWASSVAVDADGDFVVVWDSDGSSGSDSSGYGILGQRFDSEGLALGGEFQVNTYTTSQQFWPSVAVTDDGDFVVAWQGYGSTEGDTSSSSIHARRFASNGIGLGEEFQVNTYTTSWQVYGSVGVDADGDFVVVWSSASSPDDAWRSVQGQRFGSDGAAVGGEFQVNTYVNGLQQTRFGRPVAVRPDGQFVVTWHGSGDGTDTSWYSVNARQFPEPIFADGFESGDTTAWSTTVP